MKTKKIELEVDFIGEQDILANEEQKALSDFFKKRKMEIEIESKSVRKPKSKKPCLNQYSLRQSVKRSGISPTTISTDLKLRPNLKQ